MSEMEEVLQRLDQLERKNRLWKWVGLTALLSSAAIFLMGQAPSPQAITAHSVTIVDDWGRKRALLAGADSGPALAFFDQEGKQTAGLFTVQEGSGLVLYSKEGRTGVELGTTLVGARLSLTGLDEESGASLEVVVQRGASLRFTDENGKVSYCLPPERSE